MWCHESILCALKRWGWLKLANYCFICEWSTPVGSYNGYVKHILFWLHFLSRQRRWIVLYNFEASFVFRTGDCEALMLTLIQYTHNWCLIKWFILIIVLHVLIMNYYSWDSEDGLLSWKHISCQKQRYCWITH